MAVKKDLIFSLRWSAQKMYIFFFFLTLDFRNVNLLLLLIVGRIMEKNKTPETDKQWAQPMIEKDRDTNSHYMVLSQLVKLKS